MGELRAQLREIQVTLAAQVAPPAAPPAAPAARRPAVLPLAEMGYCWTHGYSGNLGHTSISCVNRAEGHQQNATHEDQMTGNSRIWTRADRRAPR
eukprot:scaffold24108_cov43-Attheya_sp.AAC.1